MLRPRADHAGEDACLHSALVDCSWACTDGALFYRIQRIVGVATQEYGPSRASAFVALSIVLAGLVFSVNWARGQSRPTENYLVQGECLLLRGGANDLALQKFQEGMAADPASRTTYQKQLHRSPPDADGQEGRRQPRSIRNC